LRFLVFHGKMPALDLREKDISLRMLTRVLPLLDKLHACGTERDTAGNRTLFFDDYAKLVLVYLFNPLIDSISMLQRAAALPKLARQLGIKDFSKPSFSEASAVFDPGMLQAVVSELAGELRKLPADPRLADIKQAIQLADGTMLTALPKLVETLYRPNRDGTPHHAWRVHAVLDLEHGVPTVMHLTGASPRGVDNEQRVLEAVVEKNHLYVADRGYFDKKLLSRIVQAGSSYVFRVPENIRYDVVEQRPLSPAAIAAGVLGDAVVRLEDLAHPVRLVKVKADLHTKRTRKGYVTSSGEMLLLCDDLELAAELISLLYSYRWTIETFFKFLKQLLGCRHLISQRKNGVQIQVYCAMIACMLLNLWTGIKPAKAVMEMFLWHALGFADDEDVIKQIDKTRREQEKARAKKLGR
jgi:Transposase DDE domain